MFAEASDLDPRAFHAHVTQTRPHLHDVLTLVMGHCAPRRAVVVYDTRCALACVLGAAYQRCLPDAHMLAFDPQTEPEILAVFQALEEGDLVVLVQSDSFRLPTYRIRVELYKRAIKVIAHANLSRIEPDEIPRYLASLAYDPNYYRGVGAALKQAIDAAQSARVETGNGCVLHYNSPMEPAKLNTGDFTGLANVGSQFPIGEVFTEPKSLEAVHGSVRIYAFADTVGRLQVPPEPITLVIREGKVVATESSTEGFDAVLARITEDEGCVWLRELGFGMNRAFSREERVSDVGAFERVCGIHISLGAKHGVYKKAQIKHREARHHVDVFAQTEGVWLEAARVFHDGAWNVA
jgi:aminopeptidase